MPQNNYFKSFPKACEIKFWNWSSFDCCYFFVLQGILKNFTIITDLGFWLMEREREMSFFPWCSVRTFPNCHNKNYRNCKIYRHDTQSFCIGLCISVAPFSWLKMVLSIFHEFLKHGDTLQLCFFIGGFITNPLHYVKLQLLHVIAL